MYCLGARSRPRTPTPVVLVPRRIRFLPHQGHGDHGQSYKQHAVQETDNPIDKTGGEEEGMTPSMRATSNDRDTVCYGAVLLPGRQEGPEGVGRDRTVAQASLTTARD